MMHLTLKEFKDFCRQKQITKYIFNTNNQTIEQKFTIDLDVEFDAVDVIVKSGRVVFKCNGKRTMMELPHVTRVTMLSDDPFIGTLLAFERGNVDKNEYQIVAKIIAE